MKHILYTAPVIMLRTLASTFVTLTSFWWQKLKGHASRPFVDKTIRHWAYKTLKIVNATVHVMGEKPVYQAHQSYILMSNHASLYDIPIIYTALPGSIRMIAKKELSYIPYFGTSLKHSEFIFIDRKNRPQAIEDLKKAKVKMLNGIIIWAAPEGTRTRDGTLGVFKKGIFKLAQDTDAIIIPIGIKNARHLLAAKTWRFNPGTQIAVHIGQPIKARDYEEKALSLQVRKKMMELLGDGVSTNH